MSAIEEETRHLPNKSRTEISFISSILNLAGSVRFGIVLIILLVSACLLGMLIRQHNVTGFDTYFAELGPFQQTLFGALGLFDIYHSWYFNVLLGLLSLNIVLASVERFPKSLLFLTRPNLEPSVKWMNGQDQNATLIIGGMRKEMLEKIVKACKRAGWRQIETSEKQGKTYVLAESGAWNRLGAYPVHAALLTILFGGFVSSQLSFSGEMPLAVGQTTSQISETVFQEGGSAMVSRQLPFSVSCTDLEQKLINPRGSIESANSLDWLTYLEIKDKGEVRNAVVQLNRPFDYLGYRFFHSKFLPIGKARSVLLQIKSDKGFAQELSLKQNEAFVLPDGHNIKFVDFRANLSLTRSEENENSTGYQNPAVILEIISPDGARETAFAFRPNRITDQISINAFNGYTVQLLDFERVSEQHVLFVSHDPGSVVIYTGFSLLLLSLAAVFFFSHQRVWGLIEEESDKTLRITFGGNTNRNHLAFEEKFQNFINLLSNDRH